MPAALLTRDEVVDRLFTVFRDRGYEGASLADLSRATGLGRSSLYHHFPGGKEDMAAAVLDRGLLWLDENIVSAAEGAGSVPARLRRVANALDQLYAGGRNRCVLGQLAGEPALPPVRERLARAIERWTGALAALCVEGGATPEAAAAWAEDQVARVQGALILAAATGSLAPFDRALAALSRGYSGEA